MPWEAIESQHSELPQWQKDVLNKELQAIADNSDFTIPWDSVKDRFKQP